ncbi:MAG: DUF3899 domain-containing protein [Prevotella sp.]|nr:DUF3899 domain-containing protein [Staphylococcus sp.]MCM1350940.1 DUF3899 domain-containing protein [Prevotella sp.]
MNWIKRVFIHSWQRYLIAFGLAIVLSVIYLCTRGFETLIYYIDAFSIAGSIVFLCGALSLIAYFGGFDTIRYGFASFRRGSAAKYEDLYDYSTQKKEERKHGHFTFMPYFTVGGVFIIASFILMVFQ